MKKLILIELANILQQGLPWAKKVNYEIIRTGFQGFLAHEIPCIQIIDQTNVRDPEQLRDRNTWILAVQLILKSQSTDFVDQGILFDRMNDMIKLIGENTQMNVTPVNLGDSFLQIRPIAEVTDIHSETPFFIGELNLECIFYTGTRGPCGPGS